MYVAEEKNTYIEVKTDFDMGVNMKAKIKEYIKTEVEPKANMYVDI